jgi:NADPH:quinone reductase-like Zn-dependent oxidoreductase
MQDTPYFEMEYPFIWGTDVAGTIVQLGSKVTRFKIGQRVIGFVSWQIFDHTHDFTDHS